jgi:hypothetical protein
VTRWMWTLLARNRRERLISLTSLVSEESAQQHFDSLRTASPVATRAPEA